MNFWKQTTHIMGYFKEENFRGDKRLPSSFMQGFMEVSARQLDDFGGLHANIFALNRDETNGTQRGLSFVHNILDLCFPYQIHQLPNNAAN